MNLNSITSRFIAVIVVVIIALQNNAFSQVSFSKTYGGTGNDEAFSVQQTSDGGYILAGKTNSFGAGGYDVFLFKTDASGNLQWAKTFGGALDDWCNFFQQTNDGGYIIAGGTWFGSGNNYNFFLIKTNASGNIGSCSIVKNANPVVTNLSLSATNPSLSTISPPASANASITVTSPTISVSEICPLTSVPSESSVTLQFKLLQNYPNPFNLTTTIPFLLPQRTNVTLKVYDVFGKEIATLINKEYDAGEHSIQFNANDLSTGVYFYRLQAGNFIEQKKMILIK
jgi:hypothetical protein